MLRSLKRLVDQLNNASCVENLLEEIDHKIEALAESLDEIDVDEMFQFSEDITGSCSLEGYEEAAVHPVVDLSSPEVELDSALWSWRIPGKGDVEDDVSMSSLEKRNISRTSDPTCYKIEDEYEPWDLIQLNLRASFICLSSKVRHLIEKDLENLPFNDNNMYESGDVNKFPKPKIPIDSLGNLTNNEYDEDKNPFKIPTLEENNVVRLRNIPKIVEVNKTGNGTVETNTSNRKFSELVPSIEKLHECLDGALRTARLLYALQKLKLSTEMIHSTHALLYR